MDEYSKFVQTVKDVKKSGAENPIEKAIKICIERGILKEYLLRKKGGKRMQKKRWMAWMLSAAIAVTSIGQTGVLADGVSVESAEASFSAGTEDESAAEISEAAADDTAEADIDADQTEGEQESEAAEISAAVDFSDGLAGSTNEDAEAEMAAEEASVESDTDEENSAEAEDAEINTGEEPVDETEADEIFVAEDEDVPAVGTEYTSGDYTYTVDSSGNATITDYTGAASSVTIPSFIDGYTVTKIGDEAFVECSCITRLEIPDTVTELGKAIIAGTSITEITIPASVTTCDYTNKAYSALEGPMYGCFTLRKVIFAEGIKKIPAYICACTQVGSVIETIEIPEGVTEIGDYAFAGCDWTSVEIPESVISIGENAFYYCQSLTGVKIPEGVTSIEANTFNHCTSLTGIKIPKSVTSIGKGAFISCTSLTGIEIPDNVTEIGSSAFGYCTSLAEIEISNSVTEIGNSTFSYCTSLTEIKIPDSVLIVGETAFGECNSLKTVSLGSGINTLEDMVFYNCSALTELILPESVTTLKEEIIKGTSIKEITIPAGIKYGGYSYGALSGCDTLKKVTFAEGIESIPAYICKNCTAEVIELPDSLTEIKMGSFQGCTSLEEVLFPDGLTEIGVSAFEGCTSLEEVLFPDGLTEIGGSAFEGCTSLEEVLLPDGLTVIRASAFKGCTSLEELLLPESVETLGVNFISGTSIVEIVIPAGITVYKGDQDGGPLSGCSTLKKILFAEGIKNIPAYICANQDSIETIEIPDSVVNIEEYAFYDCDTLYKISGMAGVKIIGKCAFYGCDALCDIYGMATDNIGIYAFYGCTSLTEITIPGGVYSIGNFAFAGDTSLKKVTFEQSLPNIQNVTAVQDDEASGDDKHVLQVDWELKETTELEYIGIYAFNGCTALETVVYSGTEEEWNEISIASGNNYLTSATKEFQGLDDDITGSQIQIGTDAKFQDAQTENVPYGDDKTLSATVEAEKKAVIYYIRVRSYRSTSADADSELKYGKWSDTVTLVVPLSKVENLTLEKTLNDGTMHAIDVKWNALDEIEQLTGYQIWYSKSSDFAEYKEEKVDQYSVEKILENLEKNQQYYVRIRGYIEKDGVTYEGEWTEGKITTDKVILVKEAWGFRNDATTCTAAGENKSKYFSAYTNDKAKIKELLKKNPDFMGGICYGMCQSAVSLLWDEDPSMSEIGLSDLYGVKKYKDANYKTSEAIKYAHRSQAFAEYFPEVIETEVNMQDLLKTYLDNYLEGNQRPVILVLTKVGDDTDGDGLVDTEGEAHAVLPIMYENTDKGIRVKVYDPNKPGDEDCWVEINEETFSYDGFGGTILQKEDTEDGVVYYWALKICYTEGFTDHSDEILMYIESDYSTRINAFKNENSLTSMERILNTNAAADTDTSSDASAQGYWIDKLDSYTFSDIPSGTEISLSASSHTVRLKADAECSAVLSVRDDAPCKATVTGTSGASVTVEFISYEDSVQCKQELKGEIAEDGMLEFVAEDGGIQITGADSLSLTETKNQYDEEDNVTVLSDKTLEAEDLDGTASYVISDHMVNSTAEKLLSRDTDGDGTGDEAVKDSLADTLKHGDDGNLCWIFDTETGTLYLSGSGETKDYTEETVPWAEYRDKITSVKISGELTRLGDCLFSSLTEVESIEIPENVTEIGAHAFLGDTSLKEVTIPASVTEIGEGALDGCPDGVVIVCDTGSIGETYAKENGYDTELIATHEHVWDSGRVTTAATCTEAGVLTYTCTRCGGTKTEAIAANGSHSWSAWTTTTKATVFKKAVRTHACSLCGKKESEEYGSKVKATIKFNASPLKLKTKQKTTKFKVTFAAGDSVKSWKSSNTKIVKVSGKANGACTIKAQSKAGTAYITIKLKSGLSKKLKVKVQKGTVKTTSVRVDAKKVTLKRKETAKITTTVAPITSQEKVTYTSSNKKIATVSKNGKITAKKKGKCKITVKSGSKSVKITVNVK